MNKVSPKDKAAQGVSYSGYFHTQIPAPDPEITQTGPGTPLGEYMRRFWQPVVLSEQLDDTPTAIRIMGEDLVAFKDKTGQVAVMHRHCCHRGASLEYGIIQDKGIMCCYHGFKFDVDGTILEIPILEDKGKRIAEKLSQPAYPAFERHGVVFAYMGPPGEKPEFPEWDVFTAHDDSRIIPCTNIMPCNWMQAQDNAPDQMHASILHAYAAVEGYEDTGSLAGAIGADGYLSLPELHFSEVNDGKGMIWVAARRVSDKLVWMRINHQFLPNGSHHCTFMESGKTPYLFTRAMMTRWVVPVDDENCIQFQWRYFGPTIDPSGLGDESKMGYDNMDFLEGQVGNRPYKLGQRAPGDWEAIISQRRIAVHALENPVEFDGGVYLNRKLLRDALNDKKSGATPAAWNEWAKSGTINSYVQSSVMKIPVAPTEEQDAEQLQEVSRRLLEVMREGDEYQGEARNAYIKGKLEEVEKSY